MTPEEKAQELVKKFMPFAYSLNEKNQLIYSIHESNAKQCAIIAASEVMKHARDVSMIYDLSFDESTSFWNKVLNNLKNT